LPEGATILAQNVSEVKEIFIRTGIAMAALFMYNTRHILDLE
jgi:hypothetical protein